MDDWSEMNAMVPGDTISPISTLAFDIYQQLLWLGYEDGRVASYTIPHLTPYTSAKVNRVKQDSVKQILFNDYGLICLSRQDLQLRQRGGMRSWSLANVTKADNVAHANMTAMECMAFVGRSTTRVLVAGADSHMLVVSIGDASSARVIEAVRKPCDNPIVIMRSNAKTVVAATRSGMVYILDIPTYKVRNTWQARQSIISDMVVNSNFIVTSGHISQTHAHINVERYLSVYCFEDSSTKIIPFPSLPLWLRSHAMDDSSVFVLTQLGQIQLFHLDQHQAITLKQTSLIHPPGPGPMDIAPTMQAAAIVKEDRFGVSLWCSPDPSLQTCIFRQPIALPGPQRSQPRRHITWTSQTPLHMYGMPYYSTTLLSHWPEAWHNFGRPAPQFPPDMLVSLRQTGNYMCGPNPRRGRHLRNQIEPSQLITTAERKNESRYLSQAIDGVETDDQDPWRVLNVRFSKFGFHDFDFRFFNATPYSGLTNHLNNSYANALLQLLRQCTVIRNLALQHVAGPCVEDFCMLCELGFLVDMMEKARGSICQATNLLRTLAHDVKAKEFFHHEEQINQQVGQSQFSDMLQRLSRFLTQRIATEFRATANKDPEALMNALSLSFVNRISCQSCGTVEEKPGSQTVTELSYSGSTSFLTLVQESLEKPASPRCYCENCKTYRIVNMKRSITSLPAVLVINTMANTPQRKSLWASEPLPLEEIAIQVSKDGVRCSSGASSLDDDAAGEVYSLVGMAVKVESQKPPGNGQFVAIMNTSLGSRLEDVPDAKHCWYIFNDFLVRNMGNKAVPTRLGDGRTPSVLVYQARRYNHALDDSWKEIIDTSVLGPASELPKPGALVALDSEFVTVADEVVSITSRNDAAQVEKPSQKTVARLSVICGAQGPGYGEAFIDDYILPKEPVRDYLTDYSGIHPQDLDPETSTKHLVPLKVVIKKLWILLNRGCRFVGHGLANDFRELNMYVPPQQQIDTIDLYQSSTTRRRIKLSFLLWCVFGVRIQDASHDSVEDARAALVLLEKWNSFRSAGRLAQEIEAIYRKGHVYNFKVPNEDPAQRADGSDSDSDGERQANN